ncbi:MAG: hypothetical protein AW10_04101 [Candidatus Accumulibacter appositus]|uniref:Uncharacterized protein n=1 Tax=Candidatus Accumulibacter appositus TaxID=1454003 RepID=A0A011QE40_9PROT|nr:MAG: hypothetical protein AW10_04101 [Candidatus Accumulibacter appositus]
MSESEKTTRLSFDEFKLYYDSTEKVTDRRLETNRWNYSICIAMLIAIATITNWSLSNPALTWVGLSADALLSVMAILFCALWIGQIRDFKNLNNAKFIVLNEMAPSVDFDIDNPGSVISFCPFEKEWKKLMELHALQEIGRSNIVALKSSNIEYFIPKAFGALFLTILVVLMTLVATHWPLSSLAQQPVKTATSSPEGRTP